MSGPGAMIGAAAGATYNAARGKDPVKGALIGAALGGTGGAMGVPGLAATTTAAGTAGTAAGTAAGTGLGMAGSAAGTAGTAAGTAGTGATLAGTGSALTGAGASTAANTAFMNPAGVSAGTNAVMGASQAPTLATASPGIFANPAGYTASTNVANQVALTPGTYGPGGNLAQASSLNAAPVNTVSQNMATGQGFNLSDLAKYTQEYPVLTQMAMQTGQSLLQQREPQLQSPGLLRGTQMQVAAPQYQLGSPKVSLI